MVGKARYVCELLKAEDAAIWRVGRISSGFRQIRLIILPLERNERLDGRSSTISRCALRNLESAQTCGRAVTSRVPDQTDEDLP
jgi:hypothetical protein